MHEHYNNKLGTNFQIKGSTETKIHLISSIPPRTCKKARSVKTVLNTSNRYGLFSISTKFSEKVFHIPNWNKIVRQVASRQIIDRPKLTKSNFY